MTTTHGNNDTKRESKDSSKRRRRGHGGDKVPSASAALVDNAAYARPLEVRLPACATNKVALPPAPVTGQYKAMFEVEFANASPDTRIGLALAMRIDGYAILRNVQEVAANERQCVRLDMQTEAQKGQVASLSWRPFSRDTERLPPWLTITRAEARMSLVEPQPPSHVADNASTGVGAHPPLVRGDVTTAEVSDVAASCVPDNGVRGSNDAAKGVGKDRSHRRHHRDTGESRRRDGRRREHERDHAGDRAKHRGDDKDDDADAVARHKEMPHKDDRQSRRHRSHRSDRLGEDAGQEGKKPRDHKIRASDGGARHPRDAVVATALAAVAAARNAINNGNSDVDDDYDDESDTFVASTPLPPPARMLVPITAMGRRAHHY
ncbi:hypothetical protein pmac_cds_121 [Pandoravirus macleodensis]|uniref:Uncharacterized protein n=1 Tax=Pandoravirus macleodensis TaxID=2107707 RepID=A0A2U7UEA9_9VIRU|nr:hypothetical protein pmac_cds_121 [Pandoravirus macleodensis]AVK76809.1 hypothetical protein pmac_cds_121 [Pandoravirus macleodensis]